MMPRGGFKLPRISVLAFPSLTHAIKIGLGARPASIRSLAKKSEILEIARSPFFW